MRQSSAASITRQTCSRARRALSCARSVVGAGAGGAGPGPRSRPSGAARAPTGPPPGSPRSYPWRAPLPPRSAPGSRQAAAAPPDRTAPAALPRHIAAAAGRGAVRGAPATAALPGPSHAPSAVLHNRRRHRPNACKTARQTTASAATRGHFPRPALKTGINTCKRFWSQAWSILKSEFQNIDPRKI